MKCFYRKFNLEEYLGDEITIDAVIFARLKGIDDSTVLRERRVIVVPLVSYYTGIKKIEFNNMLFNPIPLIYSVAFDKKSFPINNVMKIDEVDFDIVKSWSFKKYSWISPLEDIPYHMPWNVSLNDNEKLHDVNYEKDRFSHIEYYGIVPYELIKFKLVLEYLKNNKISIEDNIINFDKLYDNSIMIEILYKHSLDTLPFNDIPASKKGKFMIKNIEEENITDYSKLG